MDVAYQSTQNATGTTSAAVTKPAGLAVGDLMVAFAAGFANGAAGSMTPPAGWTTKTSTALGGFGSFYSFWKIADAGDVAASTFTFTHSGTGSPTCFASVTRITNVDPTTPMDQSVAAAMSTGILTFTNSAITPTRYNNLCLIFVVSGNGGGARNASGYAMSADNPTWTEAYDVTVAAFTGVGYAMAYAPRNAITSSGGSSANASGTFSDFGGMITLDIIPALLNYSEVAGVPVDAASLVVQVMVSGADVAGAPRETVKKGFIPVPAAKGSSSWTPQPKS